MSLFEKTFEYAIYEGQKYMIYSNPDINNHTIELTIDGYNTITVRLLDIKLIKRKKD